MKVKSLTELTTGEHIKVLHLSLNHLRENPSLSSSECVVYALSLIK